MLLLSYGMNVGSFYAISTLLNQIILEHFPVSIQNTFIRFRLQNDYQSYTPINEYMYLYVTCITNNNNIILLYRITRWMSAG